MKAATILGWSARIAISAIFLWAATPKLLDPEAFATILYRYQLLSHAWISPLALYLPWIELLAAITILIPSWRKSAGLLLLGMLFMFAGAIGLNMVRGLDLDCGCFSVNGEGLHTNGLGLAKILLFLLITALALLPPKPVRADR